MFAEAVQNNRQMQDFAEMIQNCCGLSMWCFGLDGQLIDTTFPNAAEFKLFLDLGDCVKLSLAQSDELHTPFLIEDTIGMHWAVDFLRDDVGDASCILFLGPTFDARSSLQFLQDALQRLNLSVSLTQTLTDRLQAVPVLSSTNLNQYVRMLHWTLTHTTIHSYDIRVLGAQSAILQANDDDSAPNDDSRAYLSEERLLQIIREGNPEYQSAMEPVFEAVPQNIQLMADSMQKNKNSLISFIVLASRAAIEGGVAPRTALALRWFYTDSVENCRSYADLMELNNAMMEDFVHRVQAAQQNKDMSRAVRECIEYIQLHLTIPFSLADMARSVGYTEYYLTKKFKKETGLKVTDYLRDARLERARHLLKTTNKSISEISEELLFSSHSHFSKAFTQKYGISPSLYRK